MDPKTHRLWTVNHNLRAAVDQVEEGVVFLEMDGGQPDAEGPRVVFVNRGISALTGFRGEDLLGCALSTLFADEKLPFLLERLPAIADSGRVFALTTDIRCADGRELSCRWKVSCVSDPEGLPLNFLLTVAEVLPVTESQSIGNSGLEGSREGAVPMAGQVTPPAVPECDDTEAIQVQVIDGLGESCSDEELRSARMETLALLAGGIAHDFKNILTTVMANLSLTREGLDDDALRSQVEDAAKASESGCRMAEQLLKFARGGDKGERAEADVGALLDEAARLSTYGANATCTVDLGKDLWSAEINLTQVTQVINNLIINARQAMGDVGTVQTKLRNRDLGADEVAGLPAGQYLELQVIDHGCGIPADKLDDIFTAFYTTKETGNGLGLATCQTVMREHGGLIAVESEPGKGSCFSVYIAASGRAVESSSEKSGGEIHDGVGTVMVVDDQEQIRRVTSALLGRLGYEVICAETGQEAVDTYRRRRSEGRTPSAVLMDLTLPGGIDGGEATSRILEIDPEARVIACSGYLEGCMTEEQRNCGFVEILCKPYDLQGVSQVLHEVLAGDEFLD